MNVQLVGENLFARTLGSRNIPYDVRQFNNFSYGMKEK